MNLPTIQTGAVPLIDQRCPYCGRKCIPRESLAGQQSDNRTIRSAMLLMELCYSCLELSVYTQTSRLRKAHPQELKLVYNNSAFSEHIAAVRSQVVIRNARRG